MPDFNILQQPNFAQAALGGFQAGQALGKQKRLDAALGQVDLSRPETIVPILQIDPSTGTSLMSAAAGVRKQTDTARTREILPQAASGDKAAINELWGLDADIAGKLTKDHTDHIDKGVKAAGNIAIGLLQLPEGQRAAAWDAGIDTLDESYPELAQFKGQYSATNLQSVLAQAGMSKDAVDITSPKYQAVVPGGTLAQTNSLAGPVYSAATATEDDAPAAATPTQERPSGSPSSNAAAIAKAVYPNAVITDNVRDPKSALGRANPGSYHVKSHGALDVRPIEGMSFDQYVQGYKDAGYKVIESRDEVKNPSAHATGPHWHIVLGDKTVAKAGLNAPRVGTERAGAGGARYRFKGGDPANRASWESVSG